VLSREREVDGECVDEIGRDAHHDADDADAGDGGDDSGDDPVDGFLC
jgi:hypothetical protein